MAYKKRARIFLLGDQFVIVYDKQIIGKISVNRQELETEIERQMGLNKYIESVTKIFMKAVSEVSGMPFTTTREKVLINGQSFIFNIHDSELYRRYEEFIMNSEIMRRKIERQQEEILARRNEMKKNYVVDDYIKATAVQKKYKIRKRMRL